MAKSIYYFNGVQGLFRQKKNLKDLKDNGKMKKNKNKNKKLER